VVVKAGGPQAAVATAEVAKKGVATAMEVGGVARVVERRSCPAGRSLLWRVVK
jgi:hypothetical protein